MLKQDECLRSYRTTSTNKLCKKWYHMTQELTVRPLMVDLGTLLYVAVRRGEEESGFEYLILKII